MRPFVLSEFGGYSMNLSGHVWDYANSFGYRKYETPEKLMEAYSELIDKQIAPLIAKGLSAAVYTQLSDVETEVNGLLTYDRAIIKMDQNSVKALNDKIKQML
jgi:hypothetical protein